MTEGGTKRNILACHKCGQTGHFARNCKEAGPAEKEYAAENDGGHEPSVCYHCGEKGHFSRECPAKGLKSGGKFHKGRVQSLPEETLSYFRYVLRLVEENEFQDAEDRSLFLKNVLKEMKGLELRLATNPETSKILEAVVKISSPMHVRAMLASFTGKFVELASDRRASHVFEACTMRLPPWTPDESDDEDVSTATVSEVYGMIFQELAAAWPDLICDAGATHVVRSLLHLLAGRNPPTPTPGGRRRTRVPLGEEAEVHKVPKKLRGLLRQMATTLDGAFPGLTFANLTVHAYASPTLQCLCRLLAAGKEADQKEADRLLKRLTLLDGSAEDDVVEGHLDGLLHHDVGSHFMETAMEVGSSDVYSHIFSRFLEGRLLERCQHRVANFAVQHAIRHCPTQEALERILDELIPSVDELLRGSRGGVVVALVDACVRHQVGQKRVFKAVKEHTRVSSKDGYGAFITTLLCDEGGGMQFRMVGALVLQALLKFSADKCVAALTTGFLSLDQEFLNRLARDAVGSHVLDAFVHAPCIPVPQRMDFIDMMVDDMGELATDKYGSRVVERCFAAADVERKEAIASVLLSSKASLAASQFGKFTLRNCKIDSFERKRQQWRAGLGSSKKVAAKFADITGEGTASPSVTKKKRKQPVVQDDSLEEPPRKKKKKSRKG